MKAAAKRINEEIDEQKCVEKWGEGEGGNE